MPARGSSPREIELIRKWIEQGAQWQKHWSFIPPKRRRTARRQEYAPGRAIPSTSSFWRASNGKGSPPSPEADRGRPASAASRSILPVCRPRPPRWMLSRRQFSRRIREASSTGCWPRRATASAWPNAGWMPPATPTPTAIRPTASAACGAGAIGSSMPSTATCRSTGSPSNRSPATCCPMPPSTSASPAASTATIAATARAASSRKSTPSNT